MAVHVIVTGGGTGTRMKNPVNKSFILLRGKPIIAYCLQVFQNHPQINSVTITMHPEWVQETMKWVNQFGLTKVKQVVEGGKERQDSVRNGLNSLTAVNVHAEDIILVHNSANPFIIPELIDECIRATELHQSCVAAYRIKDTIKRVQEDGKIIETLKRSELWGMQTPQCARYGLFQKAHAKALKENFLGTDDVQLVERLGIQPVVVDCGYENIKITTPEDIQIADGILAKRKKESENESA